MGIEPVLIAATLRMVIAQRLLRRICKNCKTDYQISGTELAAVGVRMQMDAARKLNLLREQAVIRATVPDIKASGRV